MNHVNVLEHLPKFHKFPLGHAVCPSLKVFPNHQIKINPLAHTQNIQDSQRVVWEICRRSVERCWPPLCFAVKSLLVWPVLIALLAAASSRGSAHIHSILLAVAQHHSWPHFSCQFFSPRGVGSFQLKINHNQIDIGFLMLSNCGQHPAKWKGFGATLWPSPYVFFHPVAMSVEASHFALK